MKPNPRLLLAGLALLALTLGARSESTGCWIESPILLASACTEGTICVDWFRFSDGRVVFQCCVEEEDFSLDDPASCVRGTQTYYLDPTAAPRPLQAL